MHGHVTPRSNTGSYTHLNSGIMVGLPVPSWSCSTLYSASTPRASPTSQGKFCSWTWTGRSQHAQKNCASGEFKLCYTSFLQRTVWEQFPVFNSVVHVPHKTCCLLASIKAGRNIIYTKQTSLGHFTSAPFQCEVPVKWCSSHLGLDKFLPATGY